MKRNVLVLTFYTCFLTFAFIPATAQNNLTIERVSVASDGTQGNNTSSTSRRSVASPSISTTGRYVVVDSLADNLVPGDVNGYTDVFVYDRQTKTTRIASIASDGSQGNSDASAGAISGDGRYVAFSSKADNFVPNDFNQNYDVFVHDFVTGQTSRVSVKSDGSEIYNGVSAQPSISADGRYVTFLSDSFNLGVTTGRGNAFVHDMQTGQTTLVSTSTSGGVGNSSSDWVSISANGRYVVFASDSMNLVDGDTNTYGDIFIRDLQTQQTALVSVTSNGTQATGNSYWPSVSADGRYVAFSSQARLTSNDLNDVEDVYVHDRQTGQTTLVSVASDGTQADYGGAEASISGDGRYITFMSVSTNLIVDSQDDLGGDLDIFVHDMQSGQTIRISIPAGQSSYTTNSFLPTISGNGNYVTYDSFANNQVPNDSNSVGDVFVAPVSFEAPLPSISISHIEATQVVQDETNSVPLVTGKSTFVRVYVDCGVGCPYVRNITGKLRAYDQANNELPNSPITPINSSITAYHSSDWQLQRGDLGKTLNFTLPIGWSNGTVKLKAEVNGSALDTIATFHPTRTLNVVYVPVKYQDRIPNADTIRAAADMARVWYPTANINYYPSSVNFFPWDNKCLSLNNDFFCAANREKLKNLLSLLYRATPDTKVFGWLPENTLGGGTSDPTWYGGAGITAIGDENATLDSGNRIFAHEVGHLLGRHHSNSTGSLGDSDCFYQSDGIDSDSDWGFLNSRIQDYGLDGLHFGWLLSRSPSLDQNSTLKNPGITYDYMAYCGSMSRNNVWTSSWTYNQLYDSFVNSGTASLLSAAQASSYLVVSGLVYDDNTTATLDPLWQIETGTPPANPPLGTQYCAEAQASSNATLTQYCFDLNFHDIESGEHTNVAGFSVALPVPSGMARVVVKKGSQILAVQMVSSDPPQVTVVSPNGGENWGGNEAHTISWAGSDPNHDLLSYIIYYSPDGISWTPIGGPTNDTQMTINTSTLAGGNAAKIRVVVSDGINTSSDESDVPFTVGVKGPQVSIITPDNNATVEPGAPIFLQGTAYDLEDGNLSGAALSWSSSLDGNLGTGANILPTLSLGQHIITLTAMDSSGDSSATGITITVQQTIPQPPSTGPVLLTPVNNALINDNTPVLTWETVAKADAYRIEIDNNSNFLSPEDTIDVGGLAYEASTLVDGLYYWRVRGLSAVGDGPWSTPRTFTVDTVPPGTPTLLSPADGATLANLQPIFKWSKATDAAQYEIQLGTANPPVITVDTSPALSYTPPAPLLVTTYYWQVRAIDAAGNLSDWAGPYSVTIQSLNNASPPRNYFTTNTPTLTWSRVSWAAHYEIQVDNTPNFSSALDFTTTVPGDQLSTPTSALTEGTYYWHVRACPETGACGTWSETDSLTVDTP